MSPSWKRNEQIFSQVFRNELHRTMSGRIRRCFFVLLLCAFVAEVGHARNICVEGIYSNIGEAKGSGDMFGASLIVVDQSPVMPLKSQNTAIRRKISRAHGVYSCTGDMDVQSDLVQIEISYPKFTFQLNMNQRCFSQNIQPKDILSVLTFTGEFTGKGVWLNSGGRKEFLPRTRSYCASSLKRAEK